MIGGQESPLWGKNRGFVFEDWQGRQTGRHDTDVTGGLAFCRLAAGFCSAVDTCPVTAKDFGGGVKGFKGGLSFRDGDTGGLEVP